MWQTHSSEDARQIQEERWCKRNFEESRWSPTLDKVDIFDLRFLFDEEEIQPEKIQHEWAFDAGCLEFDGMDYIVHERVELQFELYFDEEGNVVHPNGYPPPPQAEENWEDDDWPYHFNIRQGFHIPSYENYDSGYDEPYTRKQDYPSSEEESSDDEDGRNEMLAEYLERLQLRDAGLLDVF